MRHCYFVMALVVLTAAVPGCGVGGGDVTATQAGANTVNGSIHVPAGMHSGNVATVNGSIDIGDNATAGTAVTVNGATVMGAHATADSLATVNGSVTLGEGAHVVRSVTTVNGAMHLKEAAEVGGRVQNVNGRIVLTAAHVAGGLRTVGGDVDVDGASRVEGGIVVEKSSGWLSLNSSRPRIVIGPGAVVQGTLRFERDVRLYVSDKATIGPVMGATVIRFSGDNSPN